MDKYILQFKSQLYRKVKVNHMGCQGPKEKKKNKYINKKERKVKTVKRRYKQHECTVEVKNPNSQTQQIQLSILHNSTLLTITNTHKPQIQ